MTLPTSSPLRGKSRMELLNILAERLEAAHAAEAIAQAANDAVAEVMALLHAPMPFDSYWSEQN